MKLPVTDDKNDYELDPEVIAEIAKNTLFNRVVGKLEEEN